MSIDFAIKLAIYELSKVVPESKFALSAAGIVCRGYIYSGLPGYGASLCRYGSKRIRQYVQDIVSDLNTAIYTADSTIGRFVRSAQHNYATKIGVENTASNRP